MLLSLSSCNRRFDWYSRRRNWYVYVHGSWQKALARCQRMEILNFTSIRLSAGDPNLNLLQCLHINYYGLNKRFGTQAVFTSEHERVLPIMVSVFLLFLSLPSFLLFRRNALSLSKGCVPSRSFPRPPLYFCPWDTQTCSSESFRGAPLHDLLKNTMYLGRDNENDGEVQFVSYPNDLCSHGTISRLCVSEVKRKGYPVHNWKDRGRMTGTYKSKTQIKTNRFLKWNFLFYFSIFLANQFSQLRPD